MVFPSESRVIFHPYPDELSKSMVVIPCYSLREVLSEKLRALIQRSYTAPRDFYDIWYLSNNQMDINWKEITDAFYIKMKFKNLFSVYKETLKHFIGRDKFNICDCF